MKPIEKARLDIRNSIDLHEKTILELKRSHNDLASTRILPPELLAEIFV